MSEEKNIVPWADDTLPDTTPEQTLKDFQNLGTSLSAIGAAGGLPFINPDKATGIWCYGAERIQAQEGSQWVLNPRTIMHGYRAWVDGVLKGERMVSAFEECPAPSALGEWTPYAELAYSIELVCLDGDDKGTRCLFATNSSGGREFFAELYKGVKTHIATPYPVMELGCSSYIHKKYGRIYKPLFKPLRWLDKAALTELFAAPQVAAGRAPAEPKAAGAKSAAAAPETTRAQARSRTPEPQPGIRPSAAPARRRRVQS
jgi:hypothetical protein